MQLVKVKMMRLVRSKKMLSRKNKSLKHKVSILVVYESTYIYTKNIIIHKITYVYIFILIVGYIVEKGVGRINEGLCQTRRSSCL